METAIISMWPVSEPEQGHTNCTDNTHTTEKSLQVEFERLVRWYK